MKKLSLRDRLRNFLIQYHGWISNGDLQRIVARETTYTPRTVCRRLQELENDSEVIVEYRKGHAWYRIKDGAEVKKPPNPEHIQGCGILKDYTYAV